MWSFHFSVGCWSVTQSIFLSPNIKINHLGLIVSFRLQYLNLMGDVLHHKGRPVPVSFGYCGLTVLQSYLHGFGPSSLSNDQNLIQWWFLMAVLTSLHFLTVWPHDNSMIVNCVVNCVSLPQQGQQFLDWIFRKCKSTCMNIFFLHIINPLLLNDRILTQILCHKTFNSLCILFLHSALFLLYFIKSNVCPRAVTFKRERACESLTTCCASLTVASTL